MKRTLLSLLTLTSLCFYAQHPSCDGQRYLNSIYTVDETLDIEYGSGTTSAGLFQTLYLDFFEPSGDQAVNRPLIILAFGGSFINGQKEDIHSICQYYASLGYATASIDYRLYDAGFIPLPDSVDMTDEVMKAVSDMKASVRFFREDAATNNVYKVDPDLIFVGGISSGGITALHTGALQSSDPLDAWIDPIVTANGGWTGNSSVNTQYSDDVAGILNFSGALKSGDYIDPNDPPIFSVHDDGDGVVPFANGSASVFSLPIITMQGSSIIHSNAVAAGVNSELITIPNSSGHVSYFGTVAGTDSILNSSAEFLYPLVCSQQVSVDENSLKIEMYPNPVNNVLNINMEGDEVKEIMILDVFGRLVMQQNLINGSVNIENLAPGNYILFIEDKNNNIRVRSNFVKL